MAATRNPGPRLLHIRDEIDGLSGALEGVTFEQYCDSYTLRRVTERALQIISEAARALPDELTARHPSTPWHAIIGIGNILRHEYQRVDDRRLWEVVTVHLPQLHGVVVRMLAELDE
ncbi:MAG TPA: HepT-like ribonuclease domain-containing protein [Xanthobacteraceae bacterium]|nr:HepT-like ribonuclease domain-containing protein [Xanthobacteraceae bacterium]